MVASGNLLTALPPTLAEEFLEVLHQAPGLRIERIISRGQASPAGFWYNQDADEWVVLLTGGAGLRLEGRDEVLTLRPGDWIFLPAHLRHRVEWTDPAQDSIWLAVHHDPAKNRQPCDPPPA